MRGQLLALPHGAELAGRVRRVPRASTGSGPRRPAGSTPRPGSRTRRPALYAIGTFLSKPAGFDFHAARRAAIAERDAQIEAGAPLGQRRRTWRGSTRRWRGNQAANFAWWNEEHNYLIDRRAAIPVRRATLELGARLAADGRIDRPDDMFFLFKPELFDVMDRRDVARPAGRRGRSWPR